MNTLPVSILSHEEALNAADRMVPVLRPSLAGEPFIGSLLTAIDANASDLRAGLNPEDASALTRQIHESDARWDALFRSLRQAADSVLDDPTAPAAEREPAALIEAVFATHGKSLYNESLGDQTSRSKAFFIDLATPELVAAIAALGKTRVHSALVAEQATLEKLLADRASLKGDLKEQPKLAPSRRQLDHRLNLLLNIVAEYPGLATPPAGLADALQNADIIITEIAATARARRTRNVNEAATPAEPAPAA